MCPSRELKLAYSPLLVSGFPIREMMYRAWDALWDHELGLQVRSPPTIELRMQERCGKREVVYAGFASSSTRHIVVRVHPALADLRAVDAAWWPLHWGLGILVLHEVVHVVLPYAEQHGERFQRVLADGARALFGVESPPELLKKRGYALTRWLEECRADDSDAMIRYLQQLEADEHARLKARLAEG